MKSNIVCLSIDQLQLDLHLKIQYITYHNTILECSLQDDYWFYLNLLQIFDRDGLNNADERAQNTQTR